MQKFKTLTTCLLIMFFLMFNLLILAETSHAGKNFLDMSQQEGFESGEIATEFGQSASNPRDIRVVIAKIIQAVLSLLAVSFLVLLIYGGYKYMIARGNDEQVKEARNQITQAVIGLAIILSAYSITYFVIDSLGSATSGDLFMPGNN